MAIFPSFFLGNIGQENMSSDILERKNTFLGYKNNKFKKSKIEIFPKKLTNGFAPKIVFFHLFFLPNINLENVIQDIKEQKNAFLDYKNNKLKK